MRACQPKVPLFLSKFATIYDGSDCSTEKETFTVHLKGAEWRSGRGGGWGADICILCMPSNYVGDGEHNDMLEPMHLEHVNESIPVVVLESSSESGASFMPNRRPASE